MPETLSYPGTAPSLPPAVPEAARRPRPVRVCFLIDQLTSAGTETQLVALIRRLDRRLSDSVWARCASWYRGRGGRGRVSALWPDFTFRYRRLTRRVDPADLELS